MPERGEVAMKHQDQLSFITDDQAEQMGADMAIQFMLMTLFQIVSGMADDPRGFRSDVHKELSDLVAAYKLPPMPEATKDRAFKPDPGVVPDSEVCEKSGITVVQTGYQHTDMSDRGSDHVKSTIQGMLDKFLEDDSPLKPVETKTPPAMTEPGPVAL